MQIVLGTMNLGSRTADDESRRILSRAIERGVTRIDTANAYSEGRSEALVGEIARSHPVEITTKVGIGTLRGKPEGLAPETIHAALDASLRRLGRERVERYYLHKPDPGTALRATLDALEAENARGRIAAWGLSNFAAWQTLEAIHLGAKPVAAQLLYNALVRDLEHEWLSFSAAYAVPVEAYNPLAGGLLTRGRLARDAAPPAGSRFDKNPLYRKRYWSERMFALAGKLDGLASQAGIELVALAYRWLAGAPGVAAIIIGPASVAHLDDALDAIEQGPLPDDLARAIDGAYREHRGTDARYAR